MTVYFAEIDSLAEDTYVRMTPGSWNMDYGYCGASDFVFYDTANENI